MDSTASFGYWLRRRRKALDLTQDELARQAGCATATIKKIEADERRPSRQLAERMADLLALAPEERAAFLKAARAELAPDQIALATQPLATPAAAPVITPPAAHLPTGTVTFLFTDIEGSTQLWEQHPQAMAPALARHDTLLRAAIERHDGYIFKTVGDAVCAAFARAADALAAARAGQQAIQAEDWDVTGPLRVRMALHTGATEERDGDYFGAALNRVARLLVVGHGGQILLSLATEQLVCDHLPPDVALRDLGAYRLKDLTRPEQIFQLVAPDLAADFPSLNTLDTQPTNLPAQPTPLIGRESETVAACALLRHAEVRLLTLTGPGGTGKTRLALGVAAELLDAFTDGVFFVALAPISDPGLVVTTIAQVLGIKETKGHTLSDRLSEYLREKQMLLLLDNFEQVLDAAPLVGALLAAAPQLKVLVTSREVLHLYGEHEFAVPPLAVPELAHLPPIEQLTQYEAVRLFIVRAQAVKTDFSVTNANAPAVAEICHRLDGLPLAIELAATRIKLFTPEALLKRLERRLGVLTGGPRDLPARQQTLRNTIDWSYNLLEPPERVLFARLGVFVGGCTLEATEAVCNAAGDLGIDVLDGLAALVDKSLLRQAEGPDGAPRFGMLETIREYALERLATSGEAEAIRRQHALHYLERAELAEQQLTGREKVLWLNRLDADHDNLRAALASVQEEGDTNIGVRLVTKLARFWEIRGYWSEGRAALEAILVQSRENVDPVAVRALCRQAFRLALQQDDYAQAVALAEQSLRLSRALDDQTGVADSLRNLGWVAREQNDYAHATALIEESLQLCRAIGDRRGEADSLEQLGEAAIKWGNYVRATLLYEESLALYRELGDRNGVALSLAGLARTVRRQGDYKRATALHQEQLVLRRELGDRSEISKALRGLGIVAVEQGDYVQATMLLEESLALYRELGDKNDIALSLLNLGEVARCEGAYTRAAACYEESLALYRGLGNQWGIAVVLYSLGHVALHQGKNGQAAAYFVESLMLAQEGGNQESIALCLAGFAGIAGVQGQSERAAHLFGASEALMTTMRVGLDAADRADYDRNVAAVRAQLDADTFAAAWAAGRH